MPRKKVICTKAAPYHLFARSNIREWFLLSMNEMWSIYRNLLIQTQDKYCLVVHAFVLMSNHFHLVTTTPNGNVSQAMRYLLTEVSREVGRRSGRINHIFGGRYRSSILWTPQDLAYVYKYVLRNPVRAGLCPVVEEYPFSTFARALSNLCDIPVADGIGKGWVGIPQSPFARARWLNSVPNSDAERLITLGLRHREFSLSDAKNHVRLRRELVQAYGVHPPVNS